MNNTEQQNQGIKRVEDIVAFVNGVINKIPFSGNIQESLNNLRATLQVLRPPRIMIIGRTRSGKSSLINAMCECKVAPVSDVKPETGKAEWKTYYHHGVDLVRILDTRGLQETEAPRQKDCAKTPVESIKNAIKKEYPDIILLVCKATDVYSATETDLDICESIVKEIKNIHKIYDNNSLSIIGVLSQCDLVAPSKKEIENEKKQKNIQELRDGFVKQIQKKQTLRESLKEVIPTSAYAEYEEGENGLIISDEDYRWNIDLLTETMILHTPKERRGSFARMGRVKETRLTVAKMIQGTCVVIIGIGTNAGMIGIGDIALIFLPGFGSIISATVGASATQGIGDAAIAYFLKDD